MNNAPVGRIYRTRWSFRGFAILFLVFSGTMLGVFVRDSLVSHQGADVVKLVVGIALTIAGVGITVKAFSSRIAFTSDSINSNWAFGRQRLALNAICGRREYVVRNAKYGPTHYLRLEANDGSDPLDFQKKDYRFDDAFWRWFNQLPDLDAREREERVNDDPKNHKDSNFGLV